MKRIMANQKLLEKLNNNKNVRITKIRINILECLNDGYHGHTIKDIIDHLNSKGEKVNVSSVYNTINFLIEEGIIEIVNTLDSKEQAYELINKEDLHIHLYDVTNNKLDKVALPKEIEKAITDFLDSKNLTYENIKLDIYAKKKK
ncbi:ferric uptake regulation protein [Malacoplasma penetrans HF-2]|uniref:Ferric uptake regulation protein n=2 Tax=Malacoplasma penetrans TaxID=28227 RepID=Q8EWT1_MALP2|nr:ferric uptake regulation protein [Malacoplasma penetrans HF-2]